MSAFQFATLDEIRARTPPATDWLWHGYLAGGSVTLLTSQWKTGKTTLLSVLLARMAAGGSSPGGRSGPGTAAVVSEEDEGHWAARHARLALGPHVRLMCRPFRGRPTPDGWAAWSTSLAELRAAGRLDLAVIDPLAAFLPGHSENDAGAILDFLHPLQAADGGRGGGVDPAPPEEGGAGGRADGPRERGPDGDGRRPDGDGPDRRGGRRRPPAAAVGVLAAPRTRPGSWSSSCPRTGRTTHRWATSRPRSRRATGRCSLGVLEDAPKKLTRREVLDRWPADHPRPIGRDAVAVAGEGGGGRAVVAGGGGAAEQPVGVLAGGDGSEVGERPGAAVPGVAGTAAGARPDVRGPGPDRVEGEGPSQERRVGHESDVQARSSPAGADGRAAGPGQRLGGGGG